MSTRGQCCPPGPSRSRCLNIYFCALSWTDSCLFVAICSTMWMLADALNSSLWVGHILHWFLWNICPATRATNYLLYMCFSMHVSAMRRWVGVWCVCGGVFKGMDYFTQGRIQGRQPSVRPRGERKHCCGPDECHRCLWKYIQSWGFNRNTQFSDHAGDPSSPKSLDVLLQPVTSAAITECEKISARKKKKRD